MRRCTWSCWPSVAWTASSSPRAGSSNGTGEWLSRARVPVVLVNCTSAGPALPAILSDNHAGGRLAAEHLLGLGHLHLGHVSAPRRYTAAGERLAGIREAVAAAPAAELAVVDGDSRVDGAEAATHELLDRHPETTGILCYNDLSAIGALRALRARGLQVPGDVSVVGYDDIAAAGWVEPPLTTVSQQTATMGRWAVERLVERIGQPTAQTYLVVIDDSAEARVALRFAARRAAKTDGRIEVLGIVEPQDFVQFGGVQAAIEEEQRLRLEGVVSAGIGDILDKSGVEAKIIVQQGEPVKAVRDYIGNRTEVAALVLGAAPAAIRASLSRISAGITPESCPAR